MPSGASCPLPENPDWHPAALSTDARSAVVRWRARYPYCQRLAAKPSDSSYCAQCLREVVPWRLPEDATPPSAPSPMATARPAARDDVARRRWQR